VLITIRNLFQEPIRLVLSVTGVALSIMLILILNGFLAGNQHQVSSYLDNAPGSVVIAQDGLENFLLGATSVLPPGTFEATQNTQGVDDVVPILSQFAVLDLHDKKGFVYLIGYEPDIGGGPWQLSEGREPRTDNEAVFDSAAASRHGITIGDTFELMDREITVVGLSDETTSWMASFVFMQKRAVESLLRAPGVTGYLLVTPSSGETPEDIASELSTLPGTEVLLKSEMIDNDLRLYHSLFSPPLRMMVAIAFLVGSLVVGLIIYTATIERQREYGVIKAVGGSNRFLYQVVTLQALIAALIGAVIGVGLAAVGMQFIMWVRPQFLVMMDASSVAVALAAGLLMALLAAFLPARAIAQLAPADVFRG
jgi:putative ABC transport system permease protein